MSGPKFVLRDYQAEAIDGLRASIRHGHRRSLLVLPTGAGKTVTMAFMADGAQRKGNNIWFVVHRRELMKQASRTFDLLGIEHGLVGANFMMDRRQKIQIVSLGVFQQRSKYLPDPDIIIFDEAHHSVSPTWVAAFQKYPKALLIGLTATPCRADGKGLGDIYTNMVMGPPVRELIECGALCDYRLFSPELDIDVSRVSRDKDGDFQKKGLEEVVDKPSIVGDIVRHYQTIAPGTRAIVFAVSIQHSKHIVEQFRTQGIAAEHIDGSPELMGDRDKIIGRFSTGETQVMVNCDLVSEGFDVPAIETVIQARPTGSLSLHLQQLGRGLRVLEGKRHAILIDHCNNWRRHGLPDDDRDWSLSPSESKNNRKAKPDDDGLKVKQCEKCFSVHAPAPACPHCGHVYEVKSRKVDEVEGVLEEVNLAEARAASTAKRRAEISQCKTLAELEAYGELHGYDSQWAAYLWQSRLDAAANREHLREMKESQP